MNHWLFCFLISSVLISSGCSTVNYYSHAITGHLQLTTGLTPIEKLIKGDKSDKELKRQLELVVELKEFAENKLSLDVGRAYSKYKHLNRSAAVWVVYAAPPFSTELQSWNYPIVGKYQSRGFFIESTADEYANKLRKKGLDVFIGEAIAYSTLGWFSDPLLSTFLHNDDEHLAETLFHELAHRTYYLAGDTTLNESFATAFAQKSVQLWLRENRETKRLLAYNENLERREEFRHLIEQTKKQLDSIYENKGDYPENKLREQKGACIESFKQKCQQLRKNWNSYDALKSWTNQEVNNARLAAAAIYLTKVPYFNELWNRANENPRTYLEMVKRKY